MAQLVRRQQGAFGNKLIFINLFRVKMKGYR